MLFKSVAKGLTSGSERSPVGFGKVRLRRAFAALVGEMPVESTNVEGASCLPGLDKPVDSFQSAAATVDSRLYYLRKCSYLLFRKSKTARLALSY